MRQRRVKGQILSPVYEVAAPVLLLERRTHRHKFRIDPPPREPQSDDGFALECGREVWAATVAPRELYPR